MELQPLYATIAQYSCSVRKLPLLNSQQYAQKSRTNFYLAPNDTCAKEGRVDRQTFQDFSCEEDGSGGTSENSGPVLCGLKQLSPFFPDLWQVFVTMVEVLHCSVSCSHSHPTCAKWEIFCVSAFLSPGSLSDICILIIWVSTFYFGNPETLLWLI